MHGSVQRFEELLLRFLQPRLAIMADAGRDVTEQEAEMVSYAKDADSRAQSFNTVNKDFSVGADDVPNLDHDPILPGRRRMLLLACMCILGESRSFPAHVQHGATFDLLLTLANILYRRQRAVRKVSPTRLSCSAVLLSPAAAAGPSCIGTRTSET